MVISAEPPTTRRDVPYELLGAWTRLQQRVEIDGDNHWTISGSISAQLRIPGGTISSLRLAWRCARGSIVSSQEGRERLYRHCEHHSCLNPWHHEKHARPRGDQDDLTNAIHSGLAYRGISLREACVESGLNFFTVRGWLRGHTPRREDVLTLADTLRTPSIATARETLWRRIIIVCRDCGDERQYAPFEIRDRTRKVDRMTDVSGFDDLCIDDVAGRGEYVCRNCMHKKRKGYKRMIGNLLKREGRRAPSRRTKSAEPMLVNATLQKRGKSTPVATATPEERTAWAAQVHVYNTGRIYSEEHRRRISRGRFTSSFSGALKVCRLCKLLVESPAKLADKPSETHQKCLADWWRGRPRPDGARPYPSAIKGQRSSEYHIESYRLVVEHSLKGKTIQSLAEDIERSAEAVEDRINKFVSLIPADDARAGRQLRRLRRALFLEAEESGRDAGSSLVSPL